MAHTKKPAKKTDQELKQLITTAIENVSYVFTGHAKKRKSNRDISDLDVLNILRWKKGRQTKRNKAKEIYENHNNDWNYCYEGIDVDDNKIRVCFSFDEDLLLIITVIRIK